MVVSNFWKERDAVLRAGDRNISQRNLGGATIICERGVL